jgi:hypothetical protein
VVMLLRFNGLGADPEQIRHRFGAATIGISEAAAAIAVHFRNARCTQPLRFEISKVYRSPIAEPENTALQSANSAEIQNSRFGWTGDARWRREKIGHKQILSLARAACLRVREAGHAVARPLAVQARFRRCERAWRAVATRLLWRRKGPTPLPLAFSCILSGGNHHG